MDSFSYNGQVYYYVITEADDMNIVSVIDDYGNAIDDGHIIELAMQDYEENNENC
jgi:hypothetical protein